MYGWVALAWAGEAAVVGEREDADPYRWLEHRRRGAVREWTSSHDGETRAWVAEDGLLESIGAWRRRSLDDREAVTGLVDHRAGTAVWSVSEPVLRPDPAEDAPDRGRTWRSSLYAQRPGEAFPGELLATFEPEARWCLVQLSPDGAAVVWGRSDPIDLDEKEPPKEPRGCHLFRQPIGGEPAPLFDVAGGASLAWSSERLWVVHRDGRRGVITELGPDGAATEVVRRSGPLAAWLVPDGRAIVWTSTGSGWGTDPNLRVATGPVGDLDWLGSRVVHPWLGRSASIVGLRDDELLLTTDRDTPTGEVVRVGLERGSWRWRTLVAERPGWDLAGARLAGEDLLVVWQRDGLQHLEVQPFDGSPPTAVDLGGPWTSIGTWRTHEEQAVVEARSPTATRWWLRAPDGTLTPLDGARDDAAYVFEHHLVPADDGVTVPVSSIRRRDATPTATTPVWLSAYGGFEVSQSRGLSREERLFLDAGGVVATVHARGGGERGELWHDASVREHRDRTFEDVVAAAQWFVDQGWTGPGRLVLSGSSNGGLTTAAVVARRPDLFGAAISHAGVLDLVRGPRFGRWWPDEYGTLREPAQREHLVAESPVHRTPAGPLPPVLVVTGADDPVVDPSHSYKLVAAWGELPGGPVLLRVDAFGSHGQRPRKGEEFGPADYDAASDETLAFVFRALGLAVPAPPE